MESEKLLEFQIAKAETIKRRKFNPYKSVMGKNPTAVELASWSHDRWLDFLQFTAMFIEKEDDKEAFKITDKKRAVLDDYLQIPSHPFQEFFYRINKWTGEHTNAQFRFRLLALHRDVFTYLKTHPSLISNEMKILMDSFPQRMGWALEQYKIIQTPHGETMVRDNGTDTQGVVALPSMQVKMMNSLVKMADLYENIIGSIEQKDVQKMLLNEKLKALKDLSFIFSTAAKKQQTNHFSQININTKDVKGVEEGMLEFIKKTQEK